MKIVNAICSAVIAIPIALLHWPLLALAQVDSERLGKIPEGHQYVKLQMVADMWAGDDKDKVWVWNPRLRKLKGAVDAGEIDYLRQGNEKPSKRTDAKIESVIAFLRNLRSL